VSSALFSLGARGQHAIAGLQLTFYPQVKNVTYQNIVLSNITRYGIDVQQDYLNGGPTGKPTSGVPIENIRFVNVTGTVNGPNAYNYYILCGTGACSDISFSQVSVTGGGKQGSCNYPSSGCP